MLSHHYLCIALPGADSVTHHAQWPAAPHLKAGTSKECWSSLYRSLYTISMGFIWGSYALVTDLVTSFPHFVQVMAWNSFVVSGFPGW